MPESQWSRVGAALRVREEQLKLLQADVARRSGLSVPIVRRFENGRVVGNPRDVTLHKLEDAVEWERGTIRRLLAGDLSPEQAAPTGATTPGTYESERLAALEAANAALEAQLAAVAETVRRLEKRLAPKRPRASNNQ